MEITKTDQPLLIFSEGISYAHIARSLIFARWLKQLDYSILVACPDSSSSLFQAEEFETISLKIAEPKAIYQRLRQGKMMYETKDLVQYFEQDDSLLKRIQPQLVISEFRFTALQLAKKYGIPSVGLTEATCHVNFVPDKTVPDPFAKPSFAPLWLLDFIAQKTVIGELINKQTIKNISISLREASVAYGLEPLPTFFDYASQGDICLICDHPDLVPIKSLRPGDIYTGAMLWERHEPLPLELSQLDTDKKTVYICPGTQESLPTDFLVSYIQKLLEQNLQVIVSRGKRNFDLTIDNKNLFIFDFINENKLLYQVDVMVYPGGAMSTYQALSCGVPLIPLPAHANQHFYAEALARNQLGYFFRPSRLKIDALVKKTLHLLNDSITKAATKKFQQKLDSFEAKETILKRIEKLLNR
ncbi:conserved hypothetical protein [Hyella patelloides LEGE 07179]|uniref:Glycosyl transferase family 28 C-terminal domain-containing protein n=1 Tax=Hyella patelloides LEGE 07179 TaxID=945734 RepID=A0A563VST2_9CYAN|nr:glycosyltransferase [Hyella patelloides]VEP14446.1 conserved hypothetical protein [Hyella patelloides LEGE 07179]